MITKFQQHRSTTLVTHKKNEMNTVVYVQSTWFLCLGKFVSNSWDSLLFLIMENCNAEIVLSWWK